MKHARLTNTLTKHARLTNTPARISNTPASQTHSPPSARGSREGTRFRLARSETAPCASDPAGAFYPGESGNAKNIGKGKGQGFSVHIPWNVIHEQEQFPGDNEYIYAFERVILPALREFKPEMIFISSGFGKRDPASSHFARSFPSASSLLARSVLHLCLRATRGALGLLSGRSPRGDCNVSPFAFWRGCVRRADCGINDPLGECKVTVDGFAYMTQSLMKFMNGKVIACLEGGYNIDTVADGAETVVRVLRGEEMPTKNSILRLSLEEMKERCMANRVGIEAVNDCLSCIADYWPVLVKESYLRKFEAQVYKNTQLHTLYIPPHFCLEAKEQGGKWLSKAETPQLRLMYGTEGMSD